MASQKIAEFFAELGIKVSERSLKALENNLNKIVDKLEKVESRGRAMSGILKGTSKAADMENKSLQAGNKVLAERQKRYEALNRIATKVQAANRRAVAMSKRRDSESAFASPAFKGYYDKHFMSLRATGKNGGIWQKEFKKRLAGMTDRASTSAAQYKRQAEAYANLFGAHKLTTDAKEAPVHKTFKGALAGLTARAIETKPGTLRKQQSMYDNLFGAVDTKAQERLQAVIDKAHAKALEMDKRRTAQIERQGKMQEANEKRLQALAAKTAAIREAGATKAAAILKAAEMRSQSVAGHTLTRTSRSGFGGAAMGGAFGTLGSHIAGFLPGFGLAYSLANANRINQEIQGQKMALTAVTGSEQAGGEAMNRLRSMGDEIGFDWRAVSGSFTKMLASGKGAGMEQATTEQIFRSMTEYGRVMGLDGEAMKGSLRAVEQMMNKGQIMSEELKNQLGERFPAAVSLMAKAMSKKEGKEISTSDLLKMMENGQVKSDVLVHFAQVLSEEARRGGALEKAMQSTAAEQARFNNSVSKMVEWMGEAGMDEGFARVFRSMTKLLNENEAAIKRVGSALNTLSHLFAGVISGLRIAFSFFSSFANSIGMSDTALGGFILTALSLLNPFTRVVTIVSALALALESLYVYSQGGVSAFGEWKKSLDADTLAAIDAFESKLRDFADAASTIGTDLKDAFATFLDYMGESGIGGMALRSLVGTLGFMIDHMTTLLGVAHKMGEGDFAGAWLYAAERVAKAAATVGGVVVDGLDAATGAGYTEGGIESGLFNNLTRKAGQGVDWLLDQTPERQTEMRMQEMLRRQEEWEKSRGSSSDVPKIENNGNTIHIQIDGSAAPEATAKAVQDSLKSLFNLTSTAFPEEYA